MNYRKDYILSLLSVIVGLLLLTSCTKTVTVEKIVEKEVPVTIQPPAIPPIQYVRVEIINIDDSVKHTQPLTIQ